MILDGYIRVSQVNGREGESFISPNIQRDQIEGYARLHGHEVGRVFVELDQSGGRADRPLLLEALGRQATGEAQVLCVAKLDRFGRSLLDGLQAIEQVTEAGGRFVSVADDLDFASSTGRLVLRMMLSLAEWELDRVRATWDEAQKRAIARGVFTGSSVPLGYRRTKSGRLAEDPRTARLVREVFARRGRGERPGELAAFLSARVPTPTGKPTWSHSTVRSLVRRRAYLGEVRHGHHVNCAAHPALVDAATWQAAQFERLGGPGPRRIEPALLHGFLRCAGCSRVLMTSCDEHHRLVYLCPDKRTGGRCPRPVSIYASKVEPYVEACMWGELSGDSQRRRQGGLARAQERARKATTQLEGYRDHPTLPATLGADRFAAGLAARCRREERALMAVAAARSALESLGPGPAAVREAWPTMDLAARGRVIGTRLDCAVVLAGNGPAHERVWSIPSGGEPAGLPPRSPNVAPPAMPFEPPAMGRRGAPAAGSLDWSKRKVTLALAPVLQGEENWPLFTEFQAAGLGLAYANAQRHQTVIRWAQQFGLRPPVTHRSMGGWSEARVREELIEATSGRESWPTTREFIAAGRGELRKAVHYYGGAHRWAGELGLPMGYHQRTNCSVWDQASMLSAVAELARGQNHWPTRKQFYAAGLGGLYASIAKVGVRRDLAEQLGLSVTEGPRYRAATRWTEEAIAAELARFLADREWYPTHEEFRAAGYDGLFQKLGRRSGGHGAVAVAHGLRRRGSGRRAVEACV
ncbi:MAG TPA: recombinase family protein [Thermoleophilaceae bacterium]|nr:recombinase family protein [Thermoleophilaceae bacterium]